jgi:hypothetical protein
MADGAEPAVARYSAFLSYSHADARFARRLHRRLETYRLPRRVSRQGRRRLAPVFMDRAELTAAPDLSQSVRDAIAASGAMIVVCSPSAAASYWVGREIRLFRELHPERSILAAMIEGASREAFHPDLLSSPDADGRRGAPVAADFRKGGDGGRLALLKLIAPLAEVGLDDLVRRDAQRQVRRVLTAATAAVFAVLAAGVLTMTTIRARMAESEEHARGAMVFDRMVGGERDRLKRVGRLDLLDELNRDALAFFRRGDVSDLPEEDRERRAKLLWGMVEDEAAKGAFSTAEARARDALAITGALMSAHPNVPARVFDHGQSEFWLAFVRMREGYIDDAEKRWQVYADLANRLVALEPGNPRWWIERGDADSDLAMLILRRTADTDRAGPLFGAAQRDYEAAARRMPNDADLRADVEDGDGWLADVRRLSGDYGGALDFRRRQRALIETWLDADRHDAQARGWLIANDLALARLATARGEWRKALGVLRVARAAAADLADQDPRNSDIAQQERAIQLFEAEAMLSAKPSDRPPRRDIQAALGDCAAESRLPSHEELATFCRLLNARLLDQSGAHSAAAALRDVANAGNASPGYRLSERWLIDWRVDSYDYSP